MRDVNIKLTMSLDKAIKILNCFTFEKQYLTIENICRLVGIPKTTAYRLLFTLEANGLIQYDAENGVYGLGIKMFEYGGIVADRLYIKKVANPYITALHQKTNCTVTLSILEAERLIYIDKCESIEVEGFTSKMGKAREPHFGSPGRVLMADMGMDEIHQILNKIPLKKYTDFTITDTDKFLSELKKIKRQGYSVDFEEIILGVAAIAAPIRNLSGKAVAAVTAIGNKNSFMEYPMPKLIEHVCECASQISLATNHLFTHRA